MSASLFRAPAIGFAALLLTACTGTGDWGLFRPNGDAVPAAIEIPAAQAVDVEALPTDARMALRAVVLRLHGHNAAAIEAATRVAGSDLITPEPSFAYEGFAVRRVKIVDHAPAADPGDAGSVRALLRLDDDFGRSAAVSVAAEYIMEAQGLRLTAVAHRPLYAAHPRVELLIVPAEAARAALASAAGSYGALRAFAEQHAVAMREPQAVDPAARDYVAVAFVRDRVGPGATLAMRLSDQRRGSAGFESETRYLAFEPGWGAALAAGTFALDPDRSFWIKVVYDPKDSVPGAGDGERVIGLFSTAPATAGN